MLQTLSQNSTLHLSWDVCRIQRGKGEGEVRSLLSPYCLLTLYTFISYSLFSLQAKAISPGPAHAPLSLLLTPDLPAQEPSPMEKHLKAFSPGVQPSLLCLRRTWEPGK